MSRQDRFMEQLRPRLCFLSYRHLTALAQPIVEDYAGRAEIEIVNRTFGSALSFALERQGDFDCFVSAGANASLLRGTLNTPVATVKVGGYDILLALLRAIKISDRVGIVTHRQTIGELDAVKDVLRVEVGQRAYLVADEAIEAANTLVQDGYNVIVGSSIVVEVAERLGVHGILAYSTDSIRNALNDALELSRIARLESSRFEQLNAVLQNLQEAVLAVDHDNRLVAVNKPMEALLGRKPNRALGFDLAEIEPELSLDETLESGRAERGELLRVRRREWIANRNPIWENGAVVGALMTLYDPLTIRDADIALRARQRQRSAPAARYTFSDIVGKSRAISKTKEAAARFAKTDLTVLISGESGTGKELFAQAIHNLSDRAERPFLAINCSAFPETLLESELFGYEEGAFTGSRKGGKSGLFEAAHSGTIFLDEIGDMPLALQTRLLRVLQEREIIRVGGVEPIPIDVRVISASHQPLASLVSERRFRSDLFYRLNTLPLHLPGLRDRVDDIEPLARHFIARCLERVESHHDVASVLGLVLPRMLRYDWPGNIRELENLCERLAVLIAPYRSIPEIPPDVLRHDCAELFLDDGFETDTHQDEDDLLLATLQACNGNRQQAARRLGISRSTLWRKLKRLQPDDQQTGLPASARKM